MCFNAFLHLYMVSFVFLEVTRMMVAISLLAFPKFITVNLGKSTKITKAISTNNQYIINSTEQSIVIAQTKFC